MDKLEMAKNLLNQARYSNPGQTTTAYGTASSDSSNGLVLVDMGGDTVSPDDDQSIECETTFKVYEGDEVIVSLIGADGSGKIPIVVGVVGRGDETQAEIDNVKNYFWADDHGAHVSTNEQSVEGANVLLDSDSLDIRIGHSNNHEDQNVVARFGRNSAYIAGVDKTRYWQIKDLRNASTSLAQIVDIFGGNSSMSSYQTNFFLSKISSVKQNDILLTEGIDYIVNYSVSTINYINPLPNGSFNEISYLTSDGVFEYDEGIRRGTSGPYSKITGFNNMASGPYSEAHGYLTEANAIASSSEGYMTKANGSIQKVFGKGNVEDNENKYVEIIGNGIFGIINYEENFTLTADKTSVVLKNYPININEIVLRSKRIDVKEYVKGISYNDGTSEDSYSWYVYLNKPFYYSINMLIKHIESGKEFKAYVEAGDMSIEFQSILVGLPSYNIEDYEFYAYLDNLVCSSTDYEQKDSNVLFGNRINYYCELFTEIVSFIRYSYGDIARSNAYELDWNGNANFKGEAYLGGCKLNGETSYPAIRYNIDKKIIEYFGKDIWQQPSFMRIVDRVKLVGKTDAYHDTYLPAGTLCIMFSYEYDKETFAYRGHRAQLLFAPKPIMYGHQAIQKLTLAGNGNTGITISMPSNSLFQVKSSSANYAADYTICQLSDNIDQNYNVPVVNNGKINKNFLNEFFSEQYVSDGSYYYTSIDWTKCNTFECANAEYYYAYFDRQFSVKKECDIHAEIRSFFTTYLADNSMTSYNLYVGLAESNVPLVNDPTISEADMLDTVFLKYTEVKVTKTSTLKIIDMDKSGILYPVVGDRYFYLMFVCKKISETVMDLRIYSMGDKVQDSVLQTFEV